MSASLRQRLRYRFDNLMARGTGAQILLLAGATLVLVALTAVAVKLFGVVPADDAGQHDSFGRLIWKALMHALDAGAVGGDPGSWTFLFIMLFVTLGGIFVLSALIGILNNGFGALIEGLRRGRSVVIESGHTVVLGWSPKIDTLLSELAAAGANQRDGEGDEASGAAHATDDTTARRRRRPRSAHSPWTVDHDQATPSLAATAAVIAAASRSSGARAASMPAPSSRTMAGSSQPPAKPS